MMTDEGIHELIGAIYEAASAPEQWPCIVRRLSAATESKIGQLWFGNGYSTVEEFAARRSCFLAFECTDLSLVDFQDFVGRNLDPSVTYPYGQLSHLYPLSRTVIGNDFIPIDDYRKSDHFFQMGKPLGFVHSIASIVSRQYGGETSISFYRAEEAPGYAERERLLLDVFVPHIRRALGLYRKLNSIDTQAAALQSSIDALQSAILLINRTGNVIFINAAGEQLVRRCPELAISRDRLRAGSHVDTVHLEHLTKRATGADGRRPSGGALAILRSNGRRALQVVAAPLPVDNRAASLAGSGAVALIAIHDPSDQTCVPQNVAATLFGLTPAEARLLLALGNGKSLKEYSEEAQISQNTARTHLRSVFSKTDTSRQSDLVRLVRGLAHSVNVQQGH
jgi:DNA-binding CsgD family transcriptional regulator